MKTILREHIPFGTDYSVHDSKEEAILHLSDPHATLHQVPNNLCKKGQEQNLMDYVESQVERNTCFSVYEALARVRAKANIEGKADAS